jgi:BMFP domain-containing protein YqiC
MVTQDGDPDPDFPFDDDDTEHRRRKERVLHTRISEQLSEDIRSAAEDLRVPVSNLVRNVLEEAFGAVERVSDEVGEFLEDVLGDAEGARRDIRRLRRRVRHLARRQRRRFRRGGRYWPGETWDDAGEESDEAAEGVGEPGAPTARMETEERELSAAAESAPRTPPAPPRDFPDVLGWQPLLLNAAAPCAGCDRALAAGERVFVGATERGLSRTFLCDACMRARGGA